MWLWPTWSCVQVRRLGHQVCVACVRESRAPRCLHFTDFCRNVLGAAAAGVVNIDTVLQPNHASALHGAVRFCFILGLMGARAGNSAVNHRKRGRLLPVSDETFSPIPCLCKGLVCVCSMFVSKFYDLQRISVCKTSRISSGKTAITRLCALFCKIKPANLLPI